MRTRALIRTTTTAAAAAAVVLALVGCGSQATEPTASPTVTVAPPPVSSAPATTSATPSVPPASSPPTSSATSEPGSSATPASDPDRPSGQCADSDLGVSVVAADGGGGAGSAAYDVLITNTGGTRCVLRGTPGVSVVGRGNGTQIGAPATRSQQGVRTVVLTAGQTVAAPLQIVDIGSGGGPIGSACGVTRGDGYRVYPPHSTRAYFVQDADAVACASGRSFMSVRPVAPFTG